MYPAGVDPLRAAALLFDLDGTLVDSDAVVERCWRRWAAGAGVDAETLLRHIHGRQARDVIGELFPDRDPDRNRREGERMLAWEIADADGVVPVPGARELVASLDGIPWGIVTSCPRPWRRRDCAPPAYPRRR